MSCFNEHTASKQPHAKGGKQQTTHHTQLDPYPIACVCMFNNGVFQICKEIITDINISVEHLGHISRIDSPPLFVNWVNIASGGPQDGATASRRIYSQDKYDKGQKERHSNKDA